MSSTKKEKNYTVTTIVRKPCPKSKRRWDQDDDNGPSKILVHQGGLLRKAKAVIEVAAAVLGSAGEDVLDMAEEAVHKTGLAMRVVYGNSSDGAVFKNPSSYPPVPRHAINGSWKKVPLAPVLTLSFVDDIVTLVWDERATASMLPKYARVQGYELFGHRGDTVSGDAWKKIKYFKAGRLPMKCKLVYRKKDVVHNYAVRAVDVHNRCAPCAVVQTTPSRI